VERNKWGVAWTLVAAAAGVVALAVACTPQTECDYIDREVVDPVQPTEDDVAYCWQGYDQFGLFVFRFELGDPDAGTPNPMLIVQPPSSIEPAGNELGSTWSLIPDLQTGVGTATGLNVPGLGGTTDVQVNKTSMVLGAATAAPTALRRAVCTGFGFETAQKACRGSASRP
jgi:hypothetical protein